MKDELKGKRMKEFVGLRAKVYSFKVEDGKEVKKLKGISKVAVEHKLVHDDYVRCLFDNLEFFVGCHKIQSHNHKISTEYVMKLALANFDDKRYIQKDNISSLPYGHYKIHNNDNIEDDCNDNDE